MGPDTPARTIAQPNAQAAAAASPKIRSSHETQSTRPPCRMPSPPVRAAHGARRAQRALPIDAEIHADRNRRAPVQLTLHSVPDTSERVSNVEQIMDSVA
jgi:hypothetical protein